MSSLIYLAKKEMMLGHAICLQHTSQSATLQDLGKTLTTKFPSQARPLPFFLEL